MWSSTAQISPMHEHSPQQLLAHLKTLFRCSRNNNVYFLYSCQTSELHLGLYKNRFLDLSTFPTGHDTNWQPNSDLEKKSQLNLRFWAPASSLLPLKLALSDIKHILNSADTNISVVRHLLK